MQNLMEIEMHSGQDSEPESEVVRGWSAKRFKATQIQATACTFHREWEFGISGAKGERNIAEYVLEENVRMRMPSTFGVIYLVVLLNVFISIVTGIASTEMKG